MSSLHRNRVWGVDPGSAVDNEQPAVVSDEHAGRGSVSEQPGKNWRQAWPHWLRAGFSSFSDRRFRWWFLSQISSSSGNMTQNVALSWLILGTTGSAIDLSLVGACSFGPSLVLGSWAGTLSQRWPRRQLLIATQLTLVLLSMVLFCLDAAGVRALFVLLSVALVSGAVAAIDAPARQLFVRDIVGGTRIASAVSLNEVVINGARIFGPALGGLLLATSGPGACFLANAVSYLPPLLVLLSLRTTTRTGQSPGTRPVSIRAGICYAASRPEIRACLFLAVALGTIFNAATVLLLMTKDVLHRGGASYGSLLTAFGLGALPGALLAGRAQDPSNRTLRRLVLACIASVLVTAQSVSFPMMLAGETVIGFVSIWTIAIANTMVQLRSRLEMLSSVMGLWVTAIPGAYPLTGLLTGVVAQELGARAAFSLGGVGLALALASGWRAFAGNASRSQPDADP